MEQPWRAVRDEAAAYGQWERGKHLGGHCSGVYAAKHCQTGERAVLKKLPLQHEDEGVPGCMLREVSLLKELHHPNVVQYARPHPTRDARAPQQCAQAR